MPKMALSTVSVSVPSFLRGFTRNDGLHDVLEGLPLLEGVNECLNKLVNGDAQLNDNLCNTDNAGNNTNGGELRGCVHQTYE